MLETKPDNDLMSIDAHFVLALQRSYRYRI